jgi:hypothetical protein
MPDRTPNITVQLQRPAKAAHKSRTLWFNALVAALAMAEAKVQLIQGLLPVDAYQVLVCILVVGNAALRVVTTTGVSLVGSGEQQGGEQ